MQKEEQVPIHLEMMRSMMPSQGVDLSSFGGGSSEGNDGSHSNDDDAWSIKHCSHWLRGGAKHQTHRDGKLLTISSSWPCGVDCKILLGLRMIEIGDLCAWIFSFVFFSLFSLLC